MLYLVTTPIGNMGDITLRALEVMKSSDLILCEDTRHSGVLLSHYGIKVPLSSYEKFSESKKADGIVNLLKEGKTISLITDAGTPSVSDPGLILVRRLVEEGLEYTVVGSGCALISALVMSGLDTSEFSFYGFLPEKQSDRKALLERIAKVKSTLVFYVSPHNVLSDVECLYRYFGERKACLVREISKVYEEKIHFTLGEDISGRMLKGEMVLVTEGDSSVSEFNLLSVEEHFKKYTESGLSEKDAMKAVAKDRNMTKSEVYSILKIK